MKRTKKIALIMLAVMLMAVCFVFCASAETWGDYEYTVLEDGTVEITKYNGTETELVIPEEIDGKKVTSLGESAFSFCSDLVSVTISNSVETIGDHAFWNCDNITNIIIPKGVIDIGAHSFMDCDKLENVRISSTVNSIGLMAFFECCNLESIVVEEDNAEYSNDENGVLFDKDKTVLIQYPIGSKNTTYNIPDTVKTIDVYSFVYSLNLQNINIPQGVKTIALGAFQLCLNLTSITIPNEISNINEFSFASNPFLEKIIIEDMDVIFGEYSVGMTGGTVSDITREEFADLFLQYLKSDSDTSIKTEVYKYLTELDEMIPTGTIYCHSGSTAETYAIENNMAYELIHFFKGDWTYDYNNMVRTRKCIHCDELETEKLESTENGDVEIIEPVDPDTDFEVDEIKGDNFLVVEETVTNGIEGDVEVLKAFDINLKNSEGVHVQPDGSIKVKLPNDWSKSGIYKVYRVNDDGTLTDMNAYREGSHLVFDTDHFSIYVIVFTPDETTEEEPDTPAEPDTSDCDCICHATGFLNRILAFVYKLIMKLFAMAPLCECGVAHY